MPPIEPGQHDAHLAASKRDESEELREAAKRLNEAKGRAEAETWLHEVMRAAMTMWDYSPERSHEIAPLLEKPGWKLARRLG